MPLLHLAIARDWDPTAATYGVSTRGHTISEIGFMHASSNTDQLDRVARTFYAGVDEPLLVLVLSAEILAQEGFEVRPEPVNPGDSGSEKFPHIYGGDIPTRAVVDTYPYTRP
ncbi:DUF952 domain-containing protein [Mobilicoccus massiliensis]|uniref:DUF952 domain-containing protein n=1 Tax=Mobilicoccus massiliensis TaxID=1522310 RepID=UPI00058E1CE1|nr:DUF952 domain-containing protein [Mobilicoccus massiliensis]